MNSQRQEDTVLPIADKQPGLSGRIAAYFQQAQITPLLAMLALLMGLFAVLVTPREEEPQINVTMANVMIAFPGASAKDVESMVATPAEQVLSQIADIEHVMSVSRPGLAIITVQFKVGVPRTEALVRLYDTIHSNADWHPTTLGVLPPLIKPKGIDDVPIVTLTLHSQEPTVSPYDLERIAHSIESDLKRVPGTREVKTIGGPGRAIMVELDPIKLAAYNLTVPDIHQALQSANLALPAGDLLVNNRSILIESGQFLERVDEVAALVIGVRNGRPLFLNDISHIREGAPPARHYVWHGVAQTNQAAQQGNLTYPAVTLAITKKPGVNAIEVADAVIQRIDSLRNTVIPANVKITPTRNYGATANDKAQKLIQKLLFATLSVVALVFLALGRREAMIVGAAVILTLAATLFASWAWGFTLNRVSLFALIFSIGILVDDAIVVVENIHRHQMLFPDKKLIEIIPGAVDEVGGPTILATLTVIAALLPMAFVSGLMGPYMSPIPINASMGMLISLAIAFTVTPWLARLGMAQHHTKHDAKRDAQAHIPPVEVQPQPVTETQNQETTESTAEFIATNPAAEEASKVTIPEATTASEEAIPDRDTTAAPSIDSRFKRWLNRLFNRIYAPFLDEQKGKRNRRYLSLSIALLILLSVALPAMQLVVLKMLPFDNKSEFQVTVDMPVGTPVEQTAALMQELGSYLATLPEVAHYQAYAGVAAPINFNGLVRQYYLRASSELGDIQVNLVDKHHRAEQSHTISARARPALVAIGQRWGANVKVVEVPPGPPVLSPIVAEIYGPDTLGRQQIAQSIRTIFEQTPHIVDVDDSRIEAAPRTILLIERQKAARLGISQQTIVSTLQAGLSGQAATYLHDQSKYPAPAILQLPAEQQGSLDTLLQLAVRNAQGKLVPIKELVTISNSLREQPIYHKDLLPVNYVIGDMSGAQDSPLYGMFSMRKAIADIATPTGTKLAEYFIKQPDDPYRSYAIKWDGEWQITYETFRDMGAAYAVGLILIYLLIVAQFGSYLTPLIIMAPIPLTIIGVMPGHALLGAQYTATSMIGMIALAGIIVRNSILLVDFINLQIRNGVDFKQAVIDSATTRAQPIMLTGLAAMLGAFFILDDPIFNGLAISLIFGILVSTLLTLVVIPLLYYTVYRNHLDTLMKGKQS